ncbi:hypothetical protein HCY52_14910 [Acinetobacter radioresistens]|uniref:hypothetical protein n=1 Tax=Acinetobacter radioresistens TaxID=40216 RepID=UPI0020055F3F|nr:hypothetical protein [Acinetobacter radioresistens]MCK4085102.1 hypothetical protein [Acinetobacter radioresistens]
MKFIDFDRKFSRYLLGESIAMMFPKVLFDDNLPAVKSLVSFGDYIVTSSERENLDSLSKEKRFGAENPVIVRKMLLEALLDIIDDQNQLLSLPLANKLLIRADSFNRPKLILKMHRSMKEMDWLKCFFKNWSGFDGCSLHTDLIREKLIEYDPEYVMKTIFSKDEYKKWKEESDKIFVYRGAFESCKDGLSWTTDIEVARKFANTYIDMKNMGMSYYRAMSQLAADDLKLFTDKFTDKVSVYSIVVNKRDCIFINNRNEQEVMIPKAHLYEIEDCLE